MVVKFEYLTTYARLNWIVTLPENWAINSNICLGQWAGKATGEKALQPINQGLKLQRHQACTLMSLRKTWNPCRLQECCCIADLAPWPLTSSIKNFPKGINKVSYYYPQAANLNSCSLHWSLYGLEWNQVSQINDALAWKSSHSILEIISYNQTSFKWI